MDTAWECDDNYDPLTARGAVRAFGEWGGGHLLFHRSTCHTVQQFAFVAASGGPPPLHIKPSSQSTMPRSASRGSSGGSEGLALRGYVQYSPLMQARISKERTLLPTQLKGRIPFLQKATFLGGGPVAGNPVSPATRISSAPFNDSCRNVVRAWTVARCLIYLSAKI